MRHQYYGLIVRLVCLVGVGRLWGVECDHFSVSVMERGDECTCGGCACFNGRLDVYIKGSTLFFLLEGMGLVLEIIHTGI